MASTEDFGVRLESIERQLAELDDAVNRSPAQHPSDSMIGISPTAWLKVTGPVFAAMALGFGLLWSGQQALGTNMLAMQDSLHTAMREMQESTHVSMREMQETTHAAMREMQQSTQEQLNELTRTTGRLEGAIDRLDTSIQELGTEVKRLSDRVDRLEG